ncbi:MAG TPA: M28 family peptidase, partial [bacterium]|nr:M28 family peptidase [bacterium]
GIHFEILDIMDGKRDYYIVTSRTGDLPAGMSGVVLRSGHFLGSVPRGTILPGRRDMGYQRLKVRDRFLSRLVPRAYSGYASRDYDPFIQNYVDQVQGSYLQSLLETMVGFQTRYSYTNGCVQATNWAASEFESWGYVTELVPHTSGMAPNVIAWKYGSVNPDNIWVVGGHLDSISNNNPNVFAPGADDNGTGSGLTLCCANLLKDLNFADTVVYALWTGEEQGLYGSDAWAEWASGQGLNILGYYNFDMIGWVDPSPEDLDVLCNSASMGFGQDFVDVADMYTNLLHDLQQENVSASDHYSFWQEGYVAFCAIEDYWPTYPYYHTDQDTVDKVDFPFFTEVTKAMVANICTAAQLSETMAFGQSTLNCSSLANLMVIDFDASGTIVVTVSSDTEPGGEMVMLVETSSHLFQGAIQLTDAPPAGDAMLSVSHGDTVTMDYGGVPGTATATVDCVAPGISGVTVMSTSSQSATIGFNTSESAAVRVRYGIGTPTMETAGSSSGTTHSVTLTGLDDCTGYVFEVEAEDPAGNITVNDNGGAMFSFTTLERVSMMMVPMDTNPGWTMSGDWAWGQPTGQGGEYGDPDPTGGYTGSNVVGYN